MTIRELQEKLPWRSKYSEEFERGPAHRHFGHALHHVAKALGGLTELQDDLDHGATCFGNLIMRDGCAVSTADVLRGRFAKYIADLVILAVRLANEFPGGKISLDAVVLARVEEKNKVKLEPESSAQERLRMALAADRQRCGSSQWDVADVMEVVHAWMADR